MRTLVTAIFCAGVIGLTSVPSAAGPELPQALSSSGTRILNVSSHMTGPVNERITLALGKAAVVRLDTDARDVMVADPTTVDAVVRTSRRVFLLAQKIGQTNAFFFDAAGHQILSLDIRVERDVSDLISMIRLDIPQSNVKVAALSDNLVLTGNVASAQDAARVQDLAAQFIRDPGKAADPTKIVNMLHIASHEQVMLKVRVAEMQRQIAKQFAVNLEGAVIPGGVPIAAATGNPYGLAGAALSALSGTQVGQVCQPPSTTNNPLAVLSTVGGACSIKNNIQGTLNALEQVGLVHTLAEPNMVAVSGETAKFLAGGEFPVPGGRDQQGNIQIIFKQFGVGLSFTPVVLSDRRISLQLSTEVSELTTTGAFTINGGTSNALTIPALDVRRADTTVELP